MARGWKLWIKKVEELYYMYSFSEYKCADQLRSYCEADLRLCFLMSLLKGHYVNAAPQVALLVGGHNADVNEYPWHVMITYEIFFLCSGSILDEYTILTAAHCLVHDPQQIYGNFTVTAGEYDKTQVDGTEQVREVKEVIINELFTISSPEHDIAIIHLKHPLDLSGPAVRPVGGLSGKKFDRNIRGSPERCFMSGWGMIDDETREFPDVLQEIEGTHIILNKYCNKLLKPEGYRVDDGMICTYDPNKGACLGDNGGPLGCYNNEGTFRQVGIMSWGPNRKCSHGRSVFTRISSYRDWIRDNMIYHSDDDSDDSDDDGTEDEDDNDIIIHAGVPLIPKRTDAPLNG